MKYILISALMIALGCNQKTAPVTVPTNTAQAAPQPQQPAVVNPNIKINFKDLTIAQIEQLNALLKRTSSKDVEIKPETEMKTDQVDSLLKSLSELPFKEVASMIDLVYNSGVKQVRAQSK
jgi:biopolymer transport protein ExbD